MVLNRSLEQYRFKEPLLDQFMAAVRANTSPAERLLFTGCIVHQLNGGHVNPLPLLTGTPMIASSYQHDLWWYTPVFPREFLANGEAGIERYLDLYNVGTLVAHEPEWRDWLRERPEKYRLVWQGGAFDMYRRLRGGGGYFLEGSGQVLEQRSNGFTVQLETPGAVLKFNHLPFATSSACRISERRITESVRFIELSGCPTGVPITIQAQTALRRFFLRG